MDCCDREIMSYVAITGGIYGDMVRDLMAEAIEARFGFVDRVPEKIQWLSGNGPAYVSHDTQNFARMMRLEVYTTPYYNPESNGMAESFVKTFKRDYVHMNPLHSGTGAQRKPHPCSCDGYMTVFIHYSNLQHTGRGVTFIFHMLQILA